MVADPILTTREGIDVADRAATLGLSEPGTYAILPVNFDVAEPGEELMAVDQTDVLRRRVFSDVEIPEAPVEADAPLTQLGQRWGTHLYLPTIHFSADLLADRWDDVVAMLSRVEEYYAGQVASLDVPDDAAIEIAINCETADGYVQFVFEDRPDRLDRVVDLMAEELDR